VKSLLIFFFAIAIVQKLIQIALNLKNNIEFNKRQCLKGIAEDIERNLPQFARQNVHLSSGCAK